MATERINPLEQHVEKIVLAVAAAGALYLGSLAIYPVTIDHSGQKVAAGEIEDELDKEISTLEENREANEKIAPVVKLENFVDRYQNLVKNQPLDPKLFAAVPKYFAPANLPVGAGSLGPTVDETYALVVPRPVAPEFVSAEVRQQPVAANTIPGQPVQPPPPETILPTRDVNAVLVEGYIPVGKMRAEMAAVKDPKQRLPSEGDLNLRQAVVYRVEVRRQERSGAGWTDWKLVEPTKASLPPTDIDWASITPDDAQARRMDDVSREAKQILMPDWYYDEKGQLIQPSIVTKPPADLPRRVKQLQDEEARANGTNPTAATPIPTAGFNRPAPGGIPGEELIDSGMTEGGTPQSLAPEALNTKTQPLVPFAFWDETVEPGHEYRYQVRVRYVNPVFQWRYGLKDKEMAKLPTLDSEWVSVPNPVTVNADLAFFVMSGGRGANTASFRIFKRTAGRWYQTGAEVPIGTNVAGIVRVIGERPTPTPVEVDTGWRVVDIASQPTERVVLIDGSGKMITREPAADRDDPNYIKLQQEAKAALPPPPPPPTPTNPPGGRAGQPVIDIDSGLPIEPTTPGRGIVRPPQNRGR
jgi:hypothetical protein